MESSTRRLLLNGLILALAVTLAGSLAANVFLFEFHRQQGERAQTRLDLRATHIAGLQSQLGDTQTRVGETDRQLTDAEGQLAALEQTHQSLHREYVVQAELVATLQAEVAQLGTPSPARPTSFVTSPCPGDQFPEGEQVTIRWNALDRDGLAQVTLAVDGRRVAETAGGGFPTAEGEFVWTAIGIGEHRLVVRAVNTAGIDSNPAGVTIEVIPAPEIQGSTASQNAAIMDTIDLQVVELRGLRPVRPVTRTLVGHDQLVQMLVDDLNEEFPPEEALQDAIEMAAFDFVSPDLDLREVMEAVYTEQVAGFYDADSESLVVSSGEAVMGPWERTTYAHEYTHALQDQHYNLDSLDPEESSDDASLAVAALIEGDATHLMQQYMMTHLEPEELFELLSESLEQPRQALDNAPAIIQAQLMFPYEAGLEFVQSLYQDGGYPSVDRAFRKPPQSTEQVLHPEKYSLGEAPQMVSLPPLTETLGTGWRWVDGDVLGEFTLRLYLEQRVSNQRASAGADGWGGDRYAVYANQEAGAIAMVLLTTWDTAEDTAEFVGAYLAFGKTRFGAPPQRAESTACWQGEDAICLHWAGTRTLIIRAPTLDLAAALAVLFPNFVPLPGS